MTRTGAGVIDACREIVTERRAGMINGHPVDIYTAAAIVVAHKRENAHNRAIMERQTVPQLAALAFRLCDA
jgi:hypothetical protein